MSIKAKTDPEIAQDFILTKSLTDFELTLKDPLTDIFSIILLYFPAKGQLARQIQKNKQDYSELQITNYNNNNSRLDSLKKEVLVDDLKILVLKYNEAIILGALVQLIRDNEANITTYDQYVTLKEKFLSWPKLGIKSQKILLDWKDFRNAIRELEDLLLEKKNGYLPYLEELSALCEGEVLPNEVIIYNTLKKVPEKEIYYIVCNILLTNPDLRHEFLSLSQLVSNQDKLLTFEKTLVKVLDLLNDETTDSILKGLIYLFKQQLKDQRNELIQ